jgi:diguanylate cyclase (GGDEF)-like protein
MEFLDREIARSSRHNRPLALIMIDIDRFKNINDQFGHLGGDFTLREIAIRIKGNIRKEELFARYGGEEFSIVLPETNLEGALIVAERILKVVNQASFVFEEKSFPVTISAGVVTTQGEANISPLELIRRADEKLYQAKNAGRNRMCS